METTQQEQKDQKAPDGAILDVTEVLKAARERIAKGWTQGMSTREDDHGTEIAWCASGAIKHAVDEEGCVGCVARRGLEQSIGGGSIAGWNDAEGRTQAEVLAAFDKAIALAEAGTP